MPAESKKKFVIPFKTPRAQKLVMIGDADRTGTLEVESREMLLTAEKVMVEDAKIWNFDEIDAAVAKLAKSIYDREKALGKEVRLNDIDLAIRRLQDNAYPENEIRAENAAVALKGLFDKAQMGSPSLKESIEPIATQFEAFVEVMKTYPVPSARADKELLELYMDEVKELSKRRAMEADRRWDVYAQTIAWFRLGLEGITIEELRDQLGTGLLFRLGLFGVMEDRGELYVEEEVFSKTPERKETPELRSDDEVLKP
jgi:hypothetical protein